MANLGSLYYTLGIRDLTDADLQKINKKLESVGATITVNPVLAKSINDILPKGVDVEITPNKVAQEALDRAIEGKVMHAEILPLVDKLKAAVTDALKNTPVSLDGITIPPDKLNPAITNALTSANFTSIGDKAGEELAKSIKVKVEGQKYDATITAKTDKLADTINKALDKIFGKEQKIKLDRSDIKTFRDELKRTIGESVKVTPTLNVTQEALQKAVEGKVMRVEVIPLLTHLRKTLKDATASNPAEIEVGVQEAKLRNLITGILLKQGYMVNIGTVTGLEKSIETQVKGRTYNVKIRANATEITNSVQASLMQVQSRTFGLTVARDVLRNSIDQALMGKPFPIQIAVMHDQARRAVQNALNNARMVGKDDALAYQRLQTGELRAAQAELARLKAANMSAAEAAKAHATASINLGGALGSNIKIVGELGAAMASLYSIHAAKQFLSQVIEIGGELEHQKIALETIYGSESKMESLYGQIKGLARQSPFGVMELTKNVKQLSAYGVAYNEVYDTAKRLADISAATSVDISRLILAFGKTKNRTFLDGLEAKQFAYANIPIYDMLSKKLTELEGKFVSVKDVMGRIKKREIGFDMVKDILWDMTDEGGKFYNMQEKLAGSVKTSWKLVRDNIELMFGEIAEGLIGDWLKNIGQTLQELTRNWKALAAVITSGSVAFGVYKVAVMGTNALLEKQVGSLVANHLAEKRAQAAKLRSIGLTSTLSAREKELIATRKRLTATDLEYLYVEKGLDNEEIKRLYLSGKITRAELQKAVALGIVTQKEFEQIAGTNALNGAWLRFKATMSGTWATIKSGAASAFGMIFNWTTAAFAAIAGVTYLIQHNNEENKLAEDFSNTWKQRGEDVANELSETLKKPFENLTAPQADQLIEEYKNKIRDFAALPEDNISKAIYDKDGKILDTANQIKNLRKELETLQQTAEGMDLNLGTIINATGDGIFNEDLITNLKDWQKDFNSLDAAVLKFVNDNKDVAKEIVKTAADVSPAYASEIKNIKNLNEQLAVLLRNRTKYNNAWKAVNDSDFWGLRGGGVLSNFWKTITLQSTPNSAAQWNTLSANDAIKDLKDAIEGFKNIHEDWNWDNLTEAQSEEIRQFFKKIIETAEISSPELKTAISNIFEDSFGINLISEEEAKQKIADALNKGLEAEVGKVIFEKVKNGIELTPDETSKVLAAFEKIYADLYEKVPDIQKAALEKASKQQTASGLVWSESKTMQIVAKLNVRANWEEWQREIDDATGNLKPIQTWVKGATDIPSFVKAVQDGYKEAKTTLDQLKPLMLKAGFEFEFGELLPQGTPSTWYMGLTEAQKKMVDQYNENIRVIKVAQKAGQEIGFDPTAEYNKSHKEKKGNKGSEKDPFADAIKERIKILKEAKKEYEDLAKSIGTEAAFNELKDSPIFAGLKANKYLKEQSIPQTIADYKEALDYLQEELTAKGLKTQKHRELNVEIEKVQFEIKKKETEDALKSALDKVSKEAERQLADWNLFDKIRKATGNQNLAMSVAFGMNATAETDYPTMIKEQFNEVAKAAKSTLTFDTATPELLKDAPEEIRKAWEKANGDILKYFDQQREAAANILTEYQDLQDKLDAIEAKRKSALEAINAKREDGSYVLSDEERKKKAKLVNTQADYDKFTQSNEYLRFFNDIYGLTLSEANKIGDLIQLNLNQKLQAGLITIYDYEKEMEKVRKQLEAIRNVKSNAMTFLTGGVTGLFDKKLKEEEGKLANNEDYQKALEEQVAAQNALNKAKEDGNEKEIAAAEEQLNLANQSVKSFTKIRDAIIKDKEKMQNVVDVANIANNIAQGMSDAFNTLRDMADSFGFDTESNAWDTASAVMDTLTTVTGGVQKTLQSLMQGDIGGAISGVFDTLLTPFTIWNKLHDKKLQKDIEASQKQYSAYERLLTQIERKLGSHLGGYVDFDPTPGTNYGKDGAFGYERDLKKKQLEELRRQQADMEAMKKKDKEAIAELAAQIVELEDEVANLEIEAANAIYGIDIASWAETIGDALWDAFMKGEDALEAFDKAVSEIMSNVVKNILKVNVLERAFQNTRDWLASEDGPMSDGILNTSEAAELWKRLQSDAKNGMDSWNLAMETMPEELKQFLEDNYDSSSKNGLSAGIQSITEDTADLLASYVNAIRADVSLSRLNWDKLLESALPQINVIAEAQLTAQRQVAENTLRNAIAAEAILKSNESIYRLLSQATNGATRFYIK